MKKKMLPKLQRSQQAVVTRLICAWAMELTAEKIKALCSWISPPNPTNSVRDVCLRTLLGLSKDAHDNRKLPSSLKTRVEPLCSQQTVLPTPVRVQPVRRGRPRAATGAPGWLPGKLGWLEHYSSLRNLHLPLTPPHPLLRTTARFSVFDKVLRKVSFRSPLPTGFTPTSLTWTTDEDDSFQRTTVERPTGTSCGRKEARLRFRPASASVWGAPERHQSSGHLRTAPVYFRGKALNLYQKRALLPTRSRDDRYSWRYFFRKGGFSPIAVGSHVFLILTKDHPTSGMAVYITPQAAKPS